MSGREREPCRRVKDQRAARDQRAETVTVCEVAAVNPSSHTESRYTVTVNFLIIREVKLYV